MSNTILHPHTMTLGDGREILVNYRGVTPSGLGCLWRRCDQRTMHRECGTLVVDGNVVARRITLNEAERRLRGM